MTRRHRRSGRDGRYRFSGPTRPRLRDPGAEVVVVGRHRLWLPGDNFDLRTSHVWDSSQPNGQPRRRLDTQRARREFGFEARIDLQDGIARTVAWLADNRQRFAAVS